MNIKNNSNTHLKNSSLLQNDWLNHNLSKSYEINDIKKIDENLNNDIKKIQEKHSKTQSRIEIQSILDMCSKKLDIDPIHKKALLLRASSYIKNKDFDNVNY
jgi:hypothetical protein